MLCVRRGQPGFGLVGRGSPIQIRQPHIVYDQQLYHNSDKDYVVDVNLPDNHYRVDVNNNVQQHANHLYRDANY